MVASISFGSNAIKSYDKQSDIVYPNVISQSEVKEGHDNQSGKVAKTLMSQAGTFVVAAGVQALAGKAGIAKEVVNPHNTVQKLQNLIANKGAKFENEVLKWVDRTKVFVKKQEKTDKLIKQAGLDKTV